MGKVELDHTGSGSGITLSSDGTSLLLDGTAIGGGGNPDLYADSANGSAVTPTANAGGSYNSVAIGNGADIGSARGDSIAIGTDALANQSEALAIGRSATVNASGTWGTAVGRNSVVNGQSAVALGNSYSGGTDSFAVGIDTNSSSYGASGAKSRAIGEYSKASANNSTALGYIALASAQYSMALGHNSTASATYSHANGYEALADKIGKYSYASGKFAAQGDAQGGQFILRADTTDATATVLTTNNSTAGSTNQIVAASDTCITFDGTITAMQNGAQAYASWKIEGLLVNDGGTTTLANSATTVIQNLSSWGMALSADNTNNALAITVTGEAAHNIRWVANIRTTEVTYA